MLRDWEKQYPGRTETIFKSLANVSPSQLADRELFDFESLVVQRDDSQNPSCRSLKRCRCDHSAARSSRSIDSQGTEATAQGCHAVCRAR